MICGLCKVQNHIYLSCQYMFSSPDSPTPSAAICMQRCYIETPERHMNSPYLLPQISKTWGQSAWEALLACIKVDDLVGRLEGLPHLQIWGHLPSLPWGPALLAELLRLEISLGSRGKWRRSRLRNWVPELEGIVTWMVENGADFPSKAGQKKCKGYTS